MCCFPIFVYFCGCCVGSNWDGNLLLFGVIEQGKVKAEMLVSQLSKTICDPMDCSPPGSSVHGIFQERVLRVLKWVAIPFFLTQGLNPSLLHCRQVLYHLSPQGSPLNREEGWKRRKNILWSNFSLNWTIYILLLNI